MDEASGSEALAKAAKRLIPFLFLLYVVAYLDRVNVSFAQLQMKQDLKFDDAVYGFGAGVFFLGYFLFEIPSNLILQRVGARRWIARIMASWGLVAMAMTFTRSPLSFYLFRFLLGLTEAGFFPGMLLYLTFWFTSAERARIVACFMTANAAAFIIGGPISGVLLTLRGTGGLAGWQWLFLLEGLPALLLSGVVLAYLPDGPAQARWLSPQQRAWLMTRVQAEQKLQAAHGHLTLRAAFASPAVWLLCELYFTLVVGMYGLSFWLPQLIKGFHGLSDLTVGFLTALPYLAAAVSMVLVAVHSDRTGERRWHIAIPALAGALGLALTGVIHRPFWGLLAMAMAAAGMWSTLGPFWSLPAGLLSGAAAAGGLALVNAVGNLGGFVGPYAVGYLQKRTHSATAGLFLLATSLTLSSLLALAVRQGKTPAVPARPTPAPAEIGGAALGDPARLP